jgi:hypothetical protein
LETVRTVVSIGGLDDDAATVNVGRQVIAECGRVTKLPAAYHHHKVVLLELR